MALPKKVQEQADRAAEVQAQIIGSEPPVEGAALIADPPEQVKPEKKETDWEKRFKTQKKKYDEIVPELRANEKALSERVVELEAAEPEPAAQVKPVFTEDEIEEYGSDFLDLITRVAGNKPDDTEVAKDLKELKDQFDGIAESQARTAEDRFFDDLAELKPNWEDINSNEDFISWLSEEMPMTGKERQFFLAGAQRSFNARKVAEFFTLWEGESGGQSYLPDTVPAGQDVRVQFAHPTYESRQQLTLAAEALDVVRERALWSVEQDLIGSATGEPDRKQRASTKVRLNVERQDG